MRHKDGAGNVRPAAILFLIVGVPVGQAWLGLVGGEAPNLAVLYGALALVLALVMMANHGQLLRRRSHLMFYAMFGMLLVASLLTAAREDPRASYGQIVLLATCFIWSSAFIALFFVVRTVAEVRTSIRALDAVGLLITLSVYLAFVLPRTVGIEFGESVSTYETERAFGPLGDNVAFLVPLFILSSVAAGRWIRAGVHIGALLITGTRGAFAVLLVGLLWLMFISVRGWWTRRAVRAARGGLIAVLSVVLVAAAFLSSSAGESTRSRLLESSWSTGSGLDRLDAMSLGIQVWLDNPLAGVGFLGFRSSTTRYDVGGSFRPGTDVDRAAFSTQNQYIQTATDAGILGLATLVVLFWGLLANLRRARARAAPALQPALLGYESWLLGMLVGNQTAVWLLPSAAAGYFVFLVAGLTERIATMPDLSAAGPMQSTRVTGPNRRRSMPGPVGQTHKTSHTQ